MPHELSLFDAGFFLTAQVLSAALGLSAYVLAVLLERKHNLSVMLLGLVGIAVHTGLFIGLITAGTGPVLVGTIAVIFHVLAARAHSQKSKSECIYPTQPLDSFFMFLGAGTVALLLVFLCAILAPFPIGSNRYGIPALRIYAPISTLSLVTGTVTLFIALWSGPLVTRIVSDLREFLWELTPE